MSSYWTDLKSMIQHMLPNAIIRKNIRTVLRPTLTLYYLFTMSFRLAFRFSIEYESAFWGYLLLDYAVDLYFWIEFAEEAYIYYQNKEEAPNNLIEVAGMELIRDDIAVKRNSILNADDRRQFQIS